MIVLCGVCWYVDQDLGNQNILQLLGMVKGNYYSMEACYWVTTLKQTTKQHLLLGNRVLTSQYMQPLLRNTFTNKHFPKETIGIQQ
jgi:hypothetical protein